MVEEVSKEKDLEYERKHKKKRISCSDKRASRIALLQALHFLAGEDAKFTMSDHMLRNAIRTLQA